MNVHGFSGAPQDFFPVIGAWLVAVVIHRTRTIAQAMKGIRGASTYPGYPWLMYKILPGLKNEQWARASECLLNLWVGILVFALYSEPLGTFIVSGAASRIFVRAVEYQANVQAVQAMIDAEVRNRHIGGLHSGERDDF